MGKTFAITKESCLYLLQPLQILSQQLHQ